MIKLAFSGWMQSGKTTAADYLNEVYGADTVSFADRLKDNLTSIGVAPHRVYQSKDAPVRKLMQLYGQVMRQQDKDYWLKQAKREIKTLEDLGSDCVVIDDLRYKNEFDYLKNEGFVLVRLVVTGEPCESADTSERDLDDMDSEFDYIVEVERGDLAELFFQLDSIMERIDR
jgi:hypothetical protein